MAVRVPPVICRALIVLLVLLLVPLSYLGLSAPVLLLVDDPIYTTMITGVLTFGLIVAVRRYRPQWLQLRALPAPSGDGPRDFWNRVIACFALGFLAGQTCAVWLYDRLGSTGFDETTDARQKMPAMVLLVFALVIAPASEEALFRGVLYPLLRRWSTMLVSTALSAVLFALIHANIVQTVAVIPLALLLGLVYEQTGRLRPVIVLHIAFNVLAGMLAPLVEPLARLPMVIVFMIGFTVCFGLLLHCQRSAVRDASGDEESSGRPEDSARC